MYRVQRADFPMCRAAIESKIAIAGRDARIKRCTGPNKWKWLLMGG